MYHIFKTELNRKLKNPVLWIMILIITVLLYINIERSYESNEFDNILKYDPAIIYDDEETRVTDAYKEEIFGKNYEEYNTRYPGWDTPSFYEIKLDNYGKYREAYYDNDFKEKGRIESFRTLLDANYYTQAPDNRDGELSKYICEIANNELWHKVSGGIKHEDINFASNREATGVYPYLYNIIRSIFDARYYHYLSSNNLDYIESNAYIEFNNLYVLYNWITEIIPILVVFVTILLSYDLINKDIKEGSTKLIITQSIPRWKYYIGKFFASLIIVLFVIMLPLTISNIYLKFNVKSQPINYPIVYDNQGLKKIKPSFNYMEENLEKYGRYEYKAFYKIPYSKANVYEGQLFVPLYQRNTDLIGFDKFLLLTFFYNLLFIMFIIAFVQLISSIFNNVIISLFATVGIYGGFYYLFRPFLHGKHYNLCPFTMNNGARIVAGTHNVTMLTATIILISSTILFLVIGLKYFKIKEI